MRKVSLLFIISVLVGSVFSCNSPSAKKESGSDVSRIVENDLPDIRIKLLNQSEVDIKNLSGKVVLIFFQPDCDHCQREASQIAQNITAFKNATLYFISSDAAEKIQRFSAEYNLYQEHNVFFGYTSTESVLKNFGPIATPSIYIYSADQRLIKAFNGEVAISEVFKYL